MADTYDIGDQPTVTATIRNTAGALTNPTTVAVAYINPAGVQTAGANASTASTGIYTWTFPTPIDAGGTWYVRFTASGALVAAEEVAVRVRLTKFV